MRKRDYTNETIAFSQPTTSKSEFASRSERQAFDIGLARLIIAIIVIGIIQFAFWLAFTIIILHFLLPIAIAYGLLEYSNALKEFTYEDREWICSQYYVNEESPLLPTDQAPATHNITPIPQPKGNGYYNLHIGLTEIQLRHVAKTLLDTKTLTINYLESIGISRANAEKLRIELTEHGLLTYSSTGRVTLTKGGARVCGKILK